MKVNKIILLLLSLLFIILFFNLMGLISDYFWFESLKLEAVFLRRILYQIILFLFVFILFFLTIYGNLIISLLLTKDQSPPTIRIRGEDWEDKIIQFGYQTLKGIFLIFSASISYLAASFATENWETILKAIHKTEFGIQDPIFGKDVGYYFFTYPFWDTFLSWLQFLIFLNLILSSIFYLIRSQWGSFQYKLNQIFSTPARIHLAILLFLFSILLAWEFYLNRYELLWSSSGIVYGAGYTDINIKIPAYWFMAFFTFILGVTLVFSLFWKGTGVFVIVLGLFLGISFVSLAILPGLTQKFIVEPNEFSKEKEYIEYNISYTRTAYGLNSLEAKDYSGTAKLDGNIIQKNQATIRNIRLWDWEPLLSTYRQLQEIRLYYRFNDVDVDRYTVNGIYRQMMLSVREFEYNQIPDRAKTWINQRLRYTHGYGMVASPVNQVTEEGLPKLFIKDIPPTKVSGMELERPEIYYGELTRDYIFTNATIPEFDYPLGETNQDTFYEGEGGVPLNSFLKRLFYAIYFQNFRIQISGYITNQSRIHYYRNIQERVRKLAPFLIFDRDPYPVISQGKIYWIIDAYVQGENFPYSEKYNGRYNYIRNPVKAIIDAYNGTVQFVIIDNSEPLIQTYRKIFPELFVTKNEIPQELVQHFRYPVDLFKIQAQMYLSYHMVEPIVFYNREDMWRFPMEKVDNEQRPVEPYYMIIKLPGAEKEEFMLILPFTPVNKSNMVGWMAVGCDGENYGKGTVFKFPKQELIFGPMQIESRIDQNPEISEQITLWSQQGSKVQRGNLLVIPIEDSILYVEPLYLRAKTGQMPELKRVIVAYKNDIVMEPTLDAALRALFRNYQSGREENIQEAKTSNKPQSQKLAQLAWELYLKSEQALKNANWKEYGDYQNELKLVLQELNRAFQQENNYLKKEAQ